MDTVDGQPILGQTRIPRGHRPGKHICPARQGGEARTWLRDEAAAGSSPATPTQVVARGSLILSSIQAAGPGQFPAATVRIGAALGYAFCWSRRRSWMPPVSAPSIPRPVMTAALGQSGLVAGAGTRWKKTD